MALSPKHIRMALRLPRWPSKDHRDYQQAGRRRPRSTRPAGGALSRRQPGSPQPPAIGRIVRVRRDGEHLYVELVAFQPTPGGRAPVLARELAAAARAGAERERLVSAGDETPSWTMTLMLN